MTDFRLKLSKAFLTDTPGKSCGIITNEMLDEIDRLRSEVERLKNMNILQSNSIVSLDADVRHLLKEIERFSAESLEWRLKAEQFLDESVTDTIIESAELITLKVENDKLKMEVDDLREENEEFRACIQEIHEYYKQELKKSVKQIESI